MVFGTRPEAVKLCPLIVELRSPQYAGQIEVVVCVTAQHREMLDAVLGSFGVVPDIDLNCMSAGQSLSGLTSRLIGALEPVYRQVKPSIVIVQGDTTTTLCAALTAFYAHIPVGHVEAGLRTGKLDAPFPEELNRVMVGKLATLHFAATAEAAQNLRNENVIESRIFITGNTGIDALLMMKNRIAKKQIEIEAFPADPSKRLIVVTAHRRESFGAGLRELCDAIRQLASRGDVQVVWPLHKNPEVRRVVNENLVGQEHISLCEPLSYPEFIELLSRSYLILTDSGGIQEEGPSLLKPILVLRNTTERPEAVAAGATRLVGTNSTKIVAAATQLLDDASEYERMICDKNPYGDGNASQTIARIIIKNTVDNTVLLP